jgi:hypothetical protein
MVETGHVSLKRECQNDNKVEVDQAQIKRNSAKVLMQARKVHSNQILEMSLQT